MAELVSDCPRCGAEKITFDVTASQQVAVFFNWQRAYEAFCVCRRCFKSSVHLLVQLNIQDAPLLLKAGPEQIRDRALNFYFRDERCISIADQSLRPPPEHLPAEIEAAFIEGAKCLMVGCYNAAGTMFRLCVDFATNELLPDMGLPGGPNSKQRRELGHRLQWLFDNGLLPEQLHGLASCVKEDGNDGAHRGSLTKEDAEDLIDFATALLERLYTEPKRLQLAEQRRTARRNASA